MRTNLQRKFLTRIGASQLELRNRSLCDVTFRCYFVSSLRLYVGEQLFHLWHHGYPLCRDYPTIFTSDRLGHSFSVSIQLQLPP